MKFWLTVRVNRFLNWCSPKRKARRRAELLALCNELRTVLEGLPKA